jgi:hypothetical protein
MPLSEGSCSGPFDHEDEGIMILWDTEKHSPDSASLPRKLESSSYKMPNIPSACDDLIS